MKLIKIQFKIFMMIDFMSKFNKIKHISGASSSVNMIN